MGSIIAQPYTCRNPVTMISDKVGIHWRRIRPPTKNLRSVDCLKSKHDRALEFPDVYLNLGAYSAKIIRALFTHVRGLPTHLQVSTKYIN